jgi:hypothetical protein
MKFGWLGNPAPTIHCHMLFEMLQVILEFMRVLIVIVYQGDNVLDAVDMLRVSVVLIAAA